MYLYEPFLEDLFKMNDVDASALKVCMFSLTEDDNPMKKMYHPWNMCPMRQSW